MSDIELVKIRDTLDEALADLTDLPMSHGKVTQVCWVRAAWLERFRAGGPTDLDSHPAPRL
jgi:hypothetical protein